jgi:tRNA threonylcarbamoyladenosine biosynthesis protein TsaE
MPLALQRNLNESEAALFALELSAELKTGTWIFLLGDLGAGKTTFVGNMMRSQRPGELLPTADEAQGSPIDTQSPTYAVVQNYPAVGHLADRFDDVVHMDLYRIRDPKELLYMGLDLLVGPGSLVIVEWPSRLSEQEWAQFWSESGVEVPKEVLELTIGHVPANPEVRSYSCKTISQGGF